MLTCFIKELSNWNILCLVHYWKEVKCKKYHLWIKFVIVLQHMQEQYMPYLKELIFNKQSNIKLLIR